MGGLGNVHFGNAVFVVGVFGGFALESYSLLMPSISSAGFSKSLGWTSGENRPRLWLLVAESLVAPKESAKPQ